MHSDVFLGNWNCIICKWLHQALHPRLLSTATREVSDEALDEVEGSCHVLDSFTCSRKGIVRFRWPMADDVARG
eukprot:6238081-Prymnesium_polylepis.2